MGDPTAGAAAPVDSGNGGGGGGGKSGGGGGAQQDPSLGMGGADPSMGAVTGGSDIAAPGVDPGIASLFGQAGGGGGYDPTGTTTAQQQIAGGGNLGPPGQPPTDQPTPSSPTQVTNQSQPSMRQPNIDIAQALLRGPSSHPEFNAQPGATASLAPPRNPLPAADSDPEETNVDPSQRPEFPPGAGVHQFGWGATDASVNEPWARLPNTNLAAQSSIQKAGGGGVPNLPTQPSPMPSIQGAGGGGIPNLPPMPQTTGAGPAAGGPASGTPPTAPGDITGLGYSGTGTPPATAPTTAPGDITGLGYPADKSGAAGPATDPSGQQSQQAGMGGRMPQSPFEQLIGQLLQPLEHMIMRALGINPNALFHAFQGGNPFNRPAGPGYYPPGTVGGQPRSPQAPARTAPPGGSPPRSPPRSPGTPRTPPSALPPGRREGRFDSTLPGYPYTGETRDQPPPWYRGGAEGSTSPQGAGAPTQQDISATRVAGSDTHPTPGFSNYLRNQRAPFMREMQSNPQLKLQVAAIASFEKPNDPRAPVEALMNRASLTRTSLQNRIFFKDNAGRTFYGPINKGLLNQRMIQLQNNPQELNRYYQAIDSVGQGTNLLAGATDQGSGNDPNVHNSSGRVLRFGETYNDWFPQAAAWRRAQQAAVRRELQAGY